MDKRIILKEISTSNFNWLKDFDPFNYKIPAEMEWDVIDFINVVERAKVILVDRNSDEILICIDIMNRLSYWLELAYLSKNRPTLNNEIIISDTQAILECRKDVEITSIKGLLKKPTWPELLAAFALKNAIEGILNWQNKEAFKRYAKDLAVSSVSAITAAELLNEPIKAGSSGGKKRTIDHYNPIKEKLKILYHDKYSKISNRKAAKLLLDELSEKDKLTFATVEPEITIQKWIALWKQETTQNS